MNRASFDHVTNYELRYNVLT